MAWLRWLVIAFLAVVILGLVALYAGTRYGNYRVNHAVTDAVAKATGLEVELREADVAPLTGAVRLVELRLHNPQGFDTPLFCGVGQAEVAVHPVKLTQSRLFIPRIAFDHMEINLEVADGKANFKPILEAIKINAVPVDPAGSVAAADTSSTADADAAPNAENTAVDQPHYVVGEVLIWDLVVYAENRLLGKPEAQVRVRLPALKLRRLGEETPRGLTAEQLAASILEGVLRHVYNTGSQHLPDTLSRQFNADLRQLGRISQYESERIGERAEVLEQDGLIINSTGTTTNPSTTPSSPVNPLSPTSN